MSRTSYRRLSDGKRGLVGVAAMCLLAGALPGCMVHHVDEHPKVPTKLPGSFGAGATSDKSARGDWWKDFGDPALDKLVSEALGGSFQLKQSWARLEQVEAIARGAGAGLSPMIGARASASEQKRVMSLGRPEPLSFTSRNYELSVPVSYELDLWGKARAGKKAAAFDVLATRADVEAAAMTIAANVAETWFSIVQQRANIKLLDEQKKTNVAFLTLVRLRFGQGAASATEVLQQQQQVDSTSAKLTLAQGQLQVLQQQLSVLVGKPPTALHVQAPDTFPDLPPLPATGIPSDLLERRPDVRSARLRVVSADYRVAQAVAARYPSLSLSASLGYSSVKLSDLLDSFVYSVMGSLSASLWDGGRLSAEVDRNKAAVRVNLFGYAQTLLTAMLEVQKSLILEKQQREHVKQLAGQVHTAQRALDIARDRYRQGLTDFLPVLTTLRTLQATQTALLASQRQMFSHRVQLCRALGGTWTTHLEKPDLTKEEQP